MGSAFREKERVPCVAEIRWINRETSKE